MMTLTEAAQAVGGHVTGAAPEFGAVSTDSRKVAAGDLFVALKGERFDGHDYVAQCLEQGAAAAMVSAGWAAKNPVAGKPLLAVEDTRLALGKLAAHWRGKFAIPFAAVTGSNGKTTVKEMLAAIARAAAGNDAVLATEGNLNNDIGLPMTLFRLGVRHRYAVIEMGMNHPGEIAYLTRLVRPKVALVNNAQPAHLEGLGSMEAVARAKGEIFEGLAADGIAVVNADDAFAPLWKQLAAPHVISTFGLEQAADVSADYHLLPEGSELALITPQGEAKLTLAVPGLHNVRNALAATAAALAMGIALEHVVAGLSGFGGVKGRLQRKPGRNGAQLIDDTYNANPASMRAAIQVLAKSPGRRIFVMGDMGELGADASKLHAEIGAAAKAAGLDALCALGELSREAVKSFGARARHFESPEALCAGLEAELAAGVTLLIKGSRFMRMERVVDLLADKEKASCC